MKNILIALIIALFSTTFTNSQTSETGFSITVKNQLGELVSNAEVIVLKNGKKISNGVTNKLGTLKLNKIEFGEYLVTVSAEGFDPYISDPLTVKKNEMLPLEVTLNVSAVSSDVMIGGDEDADTESFGTTKIITEEQIQKLPDDEKELEKALRALAGDSVTGEQMPITVDGQTGGKIPPKAAIQQVRVNQNVFSAQYDGPNGGGIEIFTRSTVDKFTGGFSFGFADSRLNATDAFIGRRLPMQNQNYGFSLAGPLFSKKASFFLWAGYTRNNTSVAINAKTLNSALQPVDFQETFSTPTRDINVFSNVSYDIDKKHKITTSYSVFSSNVEGQNVGGFSLPSRANDSKNSFHNLRLSETFLVNENTVLQSRFAVNYNSINNTGGDNSPALNVLESFFGGGSQNNYKNRTISFTGGSDFSWQKNKYNFGIGGQIRGNYITQNSMQNFGGTYTFSGRTAPILDANNNPVLDANGNILTTQIDSLESYRRTLLFQSLGYTSAQIRSLGGGANQFTISGGDPEVKINQYDAAVYQQNSYKISETLAASFGFRYENQSNISSNYDFSPRFGFIWSPKGNPNNKNLWLAPPRFSVGVGRFYRRFELNNFLAVEQTNGDRSQYLITDPTILNAFPNALSVSQLEQFALPQSQRFIADDLQTPIQNLFSVTASKRLPLGFSSSFTFTYGKNENQSVTRNINAPLGGTFNPLVQNSGVRPFGSVANIYETISGARSETKRFVATLNLPQTVAWSNISYTYTAGKNNIAAGSGSPFDAYDFSQEYGSSTNDGVHRLSGYFFISKLPYQLSLDGNFDISSGSRFNIITGRDTNGDGYFLERPSFATDLTKPGLIETPYGILDPNPSPGDKLIPRNLGRGNAVFTFDMGLGKNFGFGEDKANKKPAKQSLYIGIRANNIFNVVNRGVPIGNMSSPNFLNVLSNANSDSVFIINGVRSGAGNRSLFFNVRFSFQ